MPPRPKAHLVDTNVILRYLIGDSPVQAGKSTELMERLEAGAERAEILESVVAAQGFPDQRKERASGRSSTRCCASGGGA